MNKTPDPLEVVRDKVVPAAEELVASVAERVAPFARETVEQVSPVALAAAEKTVALAHAAAERVGPLTQQAVDAVTPLAQQTREAVAPFAQSAADAVTPYAQQAAGAVAPYAALVREQGLRSGHDLAGRLEPAYEAAKLAAREALSGARDRVSSDVLPAVGSAATTAAAAATPFVAAAADRGKSLVDAVRGGDVPVVVEPPKKRGGWLRTVAIVAAAAGATYVVVRRLTGDRGSQWQAARPTTPYVPPTAAGTSSSSTASSPAATTTGTAGPVEGGDVTDVGRETGEVGHGDGTEVVASTTSLYGTAGAGDEAAAEHRAGDPGPSVDTDAAAIDDRVEQVDEVASVDEGDDRSTSGTSGTSDGSSASDSSGGGRPSEGDATGGGPSYPYSEEKLKNTLETVEERAYEEPEDAVTLEQDPGAGLGPDAHPQRYTDIAGVYVGVEPPEGYGIKGNERSMKYHLPDSNSYARTIAQVWFASEEAAQQAGFTRAEH